MPLGLPGRRSAVPASVPVRRTAGLLLRLSSLLGRSAMRLLVPRAAAPG